MNKQMVVILSDASDNNAMVFAVNESSGGQRLWDQLAQYDAEHEPKLSIEYFTEEQMAEAKRIGEENA